jgi:aryl-alcohol dehydrogenase-like predicted oxidoreductase
VMGRVGRKDSLAALGAAYEAGVTFFDTARSYGYGESEVLLGQFLRGRRDSVVISTKFGILPVGNSGFKRSLKPLARKLLRMVPAARKAMQGRIAAQFSANHFSVAALHESVETSLRALRTDYIDLLFMHEAPVSVLQQEDLLAALERLVAQGKVLRFGVASSAPVVEAALAAGVKTIQCPCNLFDFGMAQRFYSPGGGVVAIANHPFGGNRGIAESKLLLRSIALDQNTAASLREKLRTVDSALLADVVLNAITHETGIQVVVPAMMQMEHVRANVRAIQQSRFSSEEIHWLRHAILRQTDQAL